MHRYRLFTSSGPARAFATIPRMVYQKEELEWLHYCKTSLE